jgi:hypothetical protein
MKLLLRPSTQLLAGAALVGTLFACSSASTAASAGATDAGEGGAAENPTPPLRGSTVVADLQPLGVDWNAPPPLAKLMGELEAGGSGKVKTLMQAFNKALGVECSFCHLQKGASLDFEASTPNTKITIRMWNDWVAKYAVKGSDAPLFCDSCHQGKAKYLVDDAALAGWMRKNLVDGLVSKGGGAGPSCATCHGEGKPGAFLETWGK